MAIALAEVQQAIEIALTACNGGRVEPAFVRGAIAGLQPRADILAGLDDVVRVQCVVADHATNGAAAVQGRSGTAEDFHALDDLRVDIVAVSLRIGTGEKAVGHLDAVDLGQDAVAVDTANVIAGRARTLACATHGNPRLVAHQVTECVDVAAIQFLTGMYADSARHRGDILCLACGADGDLIQRQDASGGGAFFQHDAVVAQIAVVQRASGEHPFQGLSSAQFAAGSWRDDVLGQARRHAYLPAGHAAELVQRRYQRLLTDRERVGASRACRRGVWTGCTGVCNLQTAAQYRNRQQRKREPCALSGDRRERG